MSHINTFWKSTREKTASKPSQLRTTLNLVTHLSSLSCIFEKASIRALLTQATGKRNYRFTSPWQCSFALLRKYTLHSASHNIASRLCCFYSVFTPQGLRFLSVWARVTSHFLTLSFLHSLFSNTVYCTINAVTNRRWDAISMYTGTVMNSRDLG